MNLVVLQDRLRGGGTEAQALALTRLWTDAGHAARLVVFRPGGELADTPAARALAPLVLQSRDWSLDGFAPGLRRAVAALAPEVVVAFGREANAKLPLLAALAPRPLLVATMRGGRPQPERFWRALRKADAVVANSHWAAQAAARRGVAAEKTTVIYNGVARAPLPPAAAASARADLRAREGADRDTVVLLCVCGFRTRKGQDLLLRAAARLPAAPPWQLWFAGDGPRLGACRRLAARLGLGTRARFFGWCGEPAPLYAAADAAVLASQPGSQSLPNFLLEAQAAGLPVVATVVEGVAECFVHPATGLAVPPGDADALVAALARAVRDGAWRAAARAPAQARAYALFEPARNAAQWLEAFARAAPRRLCD